MWTPRLHLTPAAGGPPGPAAENLDRLLVPVRDLPLPTRVGRCLARLGVERVGDLISLSPEALLRQPRFGRGSLDVLGRVLARLGVGLGERPQGWPPHDAVSLAEDRRAEIQEELRKVFIPRDAKTLEEELRQLAAPAGSPRNASIVVRHLGWDGRGGATLESVGREHRISRQRTLAIVARVRRQYARVRFQPPRLGACMRLATPVLAEPASAVEDRLHRSGETRAPFRLEGLVRAAETLHLELPFETLSLDGNRIVARRGSRGFILSVLGPLRVICRRRGAATLQEAVDRFGGRHSIEDLIALLTLDPRFEVLGEEESWFWFRPEFPWIPQLTENRIANRIVKSLIRPGPIHVDEVRRDLARWRRRARTAMPNDVVMGICRRIPWIVTRGDLILRRESLPWRPSATGSRCRS